MDTSDMIKVTGIDLRGLIAAVFNNSRPRGFESVPVIPNPISLGVLEALVGRVIVGSGERQILYLDHVEGRACHFSLFQDDDDDLWIWKKWPGHTELDLRRVLKECRFKEDMVC